MTIEQTIEVPASRRITFEVPPEIPVGATARFEVVFSPEKEPAKNLDLILDKIRELCKDSSISVDSFLEMRRRDMELEEKQHRHLFPGDSN